MWAVWECCFFKQVHVHGQESIKAMWISECNICALTRGTILWQAKCTRYICTDKGVVTQQFFLNLELFQLRNVVLLVNIFWIWFMNKTNVCREIKFMKLSITKKKEFFVLQKKNIIIKMLLVFKIYICIIHILNDNSTR